MYRTSGICSLALSCFAAVALGQEPEDSSRTGVVLKRDGSFAGYTLYSPLVSGTTYLVDDAGRVVHTWESEYAPIAVYLLENGHLLRSGVDVGAPVFTGGGQGGFIQELDWEGKVVWEYHLADEHRRLHHDIEPLPNGNVLAIAWEAKTAKEAFRAGRQADFLSREKGLWPDCVLEIEPTRPSGGKIVWEWHLWDHLVQDVSPELDGYGKISEHPELVDINADIDPSGSRQSNVTPEQLEQMRSLGYVGGKRPPSQEELGADLCHTNAVAYHADLDQIALSVHHFNEIWILDHSTTTEEAAGHRGGRGGRGGDLLYRWGNPQNYGCGTALDQELFGQHDVRWIPKGWPGEGNLLIFNNGGGRPGGNYSEVLEITPPLQDGRYLLPGPDRAFGPGEPTWRYAAPDPKTFFAPFISGAHRLPNGNTFLCAGPAGRFFEVTPGGEVVWDYRNPFSGSIRRPDGSPLQPGIDKFPTAAFRATRLASDHPGLRNRELAPLDPQPKPAGD